ncbi:hypothetical protein TNCV_839381 [Trichonephila clavipes]|nr:hypothetical protein TNCV_839381 [Trichonephila clavipes]
MNLISLDNAKSLPTGVVSEDRHIYEGHGDETKMGRLLHMSHLSRYPYRRTHGAFNKEKIVETRNVASLKGASMAIIMSTRVHQQIYQQVMTTSQAPSATILQHGQDHVTFYRPEPLPVV